MQEGLQKNNGFFFILHRKHKKKQNIFLQLIKGPCEWVKKHAIKYSSVFFVSIMFKENTVLPLGALSLSVAYLLSGFALFFLRIY